MHSIQKREYLKIVRIVDTVIGEGVYTGYGCTLIRLDKCNLNCSYCDAGSEPVAKRKFNGLDIGTTELSTNELLDLLNNSPFPKQPWVLLTGGEPLLDKETPTLVQSLIDSGKKVLIESNGTQDISLLPPKARIAMDIKTPSSGMCNKHLIGNIEHLKHGDELRFVCGNENDIDFAFEILKNHFPKCAVSLSPVWGEMEAIVLLERIMSSGLPIRLNTQLHRIIEVP